MANGYQHFAGSDNVACLEMRSISLGGKKRQSIFVLLYTWLVMILLLTTLKPALAHTEGKMQLSAEPAGPFKMTVFTSPDPAVIGDIHVAASIFTAENASPVLDANVTVEFESLDDKGSVRESPAVLGDAENKLLFEAILDISTPGLYLVTVSVEDGDGQSGEASFELEVTKDGGFNWLYLIPAIVIGLVVTVWVVYRKNRREPSTEESE